MAVVGTHQIVVVVLPRSGYSKLITPLIECKSIQVGQYFHAIKGSSMVTKVIWHPLAQSSTSLLVLTIDGYIREYDVSVDSEEPLQTLCFLHTSMMPGSNNISVQSTKSKGFSADDERASECVSFDIGKCDNDWSPLTLYGMMKNGDIYAICPFIPTNASVSSSYIVNLKAITEAKLKELSYGEDEVAEGRTSQQLRWINAMYKQMQASELENSSFFNCNPPKSVGSLIRQGPFLTFDNDDDDDDDDGIEACDLITLNPADCPLNIFMLVFSNGKVEIQLENVGIEGRWSTRLENNANQPSLTTYETINIGDNDDDFIGYPTFLQDPLYDDTIYICHYKGVHVILIKPWLKQLVKDGAISKKSKVMKLINSTTSKSLDPIVGLEIINDAYLGYSLFSLTNTFKLLPLELSLRVQQSNKRNDVDDTFKSSTNSNKINDNKVYNNLLENPFNKGMISSKINLTQNLDNSINTRSGLEITPATLRYFGGIVDNVQKYNLKFMESANEIEDRLTLQLKETERQLDRLSYISKVTNSNSIGKGGRVEKVTNFQNDLIKRMDRILQKLMDKHQPTLSVHEKKWFEELHRIQLEVGGSESDVRGRALLSRFNRLDHQLNILKPQLERLKAVEKDKKGRVEQLPASQLRVVEKTLSDETKAIDDLRNKLDNINNLFSKD